MDHFVIFIVKCNYVSFIKVGAETSFHTRIEVVIELNASYWPHLLIKVSV